MEQIYKRTIPGRRQDKHGDTNAVFLLIVMLSALLLGSFLN